MKPADVEMDAYSYLNLRHIRKTTFFFVQTVLGTLIIKNFQEEVIRPPPINKKSIGDPKVLISNHRKVVKIF
jgi:hypothetical protein